MSKEEPITERHTVVPDGYNVGRFVLLRYSLHISSLIFATATFWSHPPLEAPTTAVSSIAPQLRPSLVSWLLVPVVLTTVRVLDMTASDAALIPYIVAGIAVDGNVVLLTVTIV